MDGSELDSLDNIQSILLVSFGGILGSNLRFLIFQKLGEYFIKKEFKNFFINTFASFLLGFFSAILANTSSLRNSYELGLFIIIGFMGGLSTFSSFIYELFELYLNFKFFKLIKIFLLSIMLGLIFLLIGFWIGSQ